MKKVLITGSTGAIGEACARYFHDKGYFVYLNYRTQEAKVNELSKELVNSQTLQFDITKKDEVISALERLEIDVLVNNAGITKDNLFFWMSDDEWNDVIDTSVNGTFFVTKAVLKNMIANKTMYNDWKSTIHGKT